MCVLLSLFIEPSYFCYLNHYTNSMIIVQNEWHIFIHPVVLPVVAVFFVPYFEFSTSHRYTRKFQKIR